MIANYPSVVGEYIDYAIGEGIFEPDFEEGESAAYLQANFSTMEDKEMLELIEQAYQGFLLMWRDYVE